MILFWTQLGSCLKPLPTALEGDTTLDFTKKPDTVSMVILIAEDDETREGTIKYDYKEMNFFEANS